MKRTSSQVAKVASLIINSKSYEEFILRGKFKNPWDAIQSVGASNLTQKETSRKRRAR